MADGHARRSLGWLVLWLGAGLASAQDLPESRQRSLLHLLKHDCGSCHGMTLRGGLGPPLTAAALEDKPAPDLVAAILFGRPGTPMPPWRGLLSRAEVQWLVQSMKAGGAP